MCEIAPGVYTASFNKRVREQVWHVIERWHPLGADRSALMIWPDKHQPGGQGIRILGTTRYDVVPWQGATFVRRDLTAAEKQALKIEDETLPF